MAEEREISESVSWFQKLNQTLADAASKVAKLTPLYKDTTQQLDDLSKKIKDTTKLQTQSTISVKDFNAAMSSSSQIVKRATEYYIKERGVFDSLGKSIDEVQHVQLEMNAAMLSGQKASRQTIVAFEVQQRTYTQLARTTEDAKEKIAALAWTTKSSFEKMRSGAEFLSKKMNFKVMAATTIGLSLGFKELGRVLTTYNRNIYEATQISSRYGESLEEMQQGLALASETTTLSKIAFSEINKSFKELYIGIPPTTKELALFASALQKNIGYSADVAKEKMQGLLTIQSRMPDILDRVRDAMKAYSTNTFEGEKLTSALYIRMKALGLSAKEVRDVMVMVKAPTEGAAGLMKMEKSIAELEKAKQDAELAISQKTEGLMIGMNKAITMLANSIAGLNKITVITLASFMGFAAVLPIISRLSGGMRGIGNYAGASRVLAGGGRTGGGGLGGVVSSISYAMGGRGIGGGARGAGGIAEGVGISGGKSLTIQPSAVPRKIQLMSPKKQEVEIAKRSINQLNQRRGTGVDTGAGGARIGRFGRVAGGTLAVAAAAGVGYQVGSAINESIMKVFGKEGKLSDRIGDFFANTLKTGGKNIFAPSAVKEEERTRAVQRRSLTGLRGMTTTMQGAGVKYEAKDIDWKNRTKARSQLLDIIKNETDEVKKTQAVQKLYNNNLIQTNEIRNILGRTITNQVKLEKEIAKITKTRNSFLRNTSSLLNSIGDQTERLSNLLGKSAERAGEIGDKLMSSVEKMVSIGIVPSMEDIATAIEMARVKASLFGLDAKNKAAFGVAQWISQNDSLADSFKKLLPGHDELINRLGMEADKRDELVNKRKELKEIATAEGMEESELVEKRTNATTKKEKKSIKASLALLDERKLKTQEAIAVENKAIEKQEEVIAGVNKQFASEVGTKAMEKRVEVINLAIIATSKLRESAESAEGMGNKKEIEETSHALSVAEENLGYLQLGYAEARVSSKDASDLMITGSTAAAEATRVLAESQKELSMSTMRAQQAWGIGPTASIAAMQASQDQLWNLMDVQEQKRSEMMSAISMKYKKDFAGLGLDLKKMAEEGISIQNRLKEASKFGIETMDFKKGSTEMQNYMISINTISLKMNDNLKITNELSIENAQLTKEMREGWLASNKEFAFNAGVWAGIIPTMTKGVTAFNRLGAETNRGTFALGGEIDITAKKVKNFTRVVYDARDVSTQALNIKNIKAMSGPLVEKVLGETESEKSQNELIKLQKLAKKKEVSIAQATGKAGRTHTYVAQETGQVAGKPIIPTNFEGVTPDALKGAERAARLSEGVYKPPNVLPVIPQGLINRNTSGGPTSSGYVISKAKTDQYKDLISQLNPIMVKGGIPGKDSVFVPGVGLVMPGEAIITGDKKSALAEKINKGQITMGSATGGSFGRNTGIQVRSLASGGGIEISNNIARQFSSTLPSSGGGEITLKLNPEVRDLLVVDGRKNYRSGTRV